MTIWRRGLIGNWAVLPVMFAFLLVLGCLQYRWSDEASEAATERTRQSMSQRALRIQAEFTSEVRAPCRLLQVKEALSAEQLREVMSVRMHEAVREARFRKLVNAVYLVFPDTAGNFRLERVAGEGWTAESQPPANWDRLREELGSGLTAGDGQCLFDGDILVMHHTIVLDQRGEVEGSKPQPRLAYSVVEFNDAYLKAERLPELAQRHLDREDGSRYLAAVTRGPGRADVLYISGSGISAQSILNPDVSLDLIGGRKGSRDEPEIHAVPGSPSWNLILQHPEGSLSTLGRRLRTHNLVVGFGVLMLLVANTVLFFYSFQYVRRLTRTQVGFVASVSHELRTPVTAVCIMADNLERGVPETLEQTRRYGELLRNQGRRLAAMVDHILQFADSQRRPMRYDLVPVDVSSAISQALAAEQPMIEASESMVETRIQDELPPVLGDSTALVQCLDNLLSNAIKYGAGGRITIEAVVPEAQGRCEVSISVRDEGPGVPASDQAFLFDPFYRGATARESQVAGSGLGLSLVKQMVEAMHGRVDVQSELGVGSSFSLRLRVVDPADENTIEQMAGSVEL